MLPPRTMGDAAVPGNFMASVVSPLHLGTRGSLLQKANVKETLPKVDSCVESDFQILLKHLLDMKVTFHEGELTLAR